MTHRGPVNLAFGTRTDLLSVGRLLGDLLGADLPVDHQPVRAGDVRDSAADSSRLQELFPGVSPVPLADGLARTLAWHQGEGTG